MRTEHHLSPGDVGPDLDILDVRWPIAVGLLGAAGLAAAGIHDGGGELWFVVVISPVVYLLAALFGSRRMAWPVAGVTGLVVGVLLALDLPLAPTLITATALFVVAGLVDASTPHVTAATVATVAFGAVGIVGFGVGSRAGALLVAAGLLGHAGWDIVHRRRGTVVAASYAEFCATIDIVVGLGLAVVAWS